MQVKSTASTALALLLMSVALISVRSARADVITIPEIKSQVPEEFVIESIALLDDFIEDMQQKKALRSNENMGFVVSGFAQVGALTGVMLEQLLIKSKLLSNLIEDFQNISTVGRVGSTATVEAGNFTRRWLVTTGAVQNITKDKEKGVFTVHPKDFSLFIQTLSEVRQTQNLILFRFLSEKAKVDQTAKIKLANQTMLIIENRPSFKEVYNACAADPDFYKSETLINMYRDSLGEYFKLLMLDSGDITAQIQSKFLAPKLNQYLKKETLPFALKKCFKVPKNANGLFEDESDRFVAQLLGMDMAAKFVVVAAVFSVWRFKDFIAYRFPGPSASPSMIDMVISKLPVKTVSAVKNLMARLSPAMITRFVVTSQVVSSGYALWVVRRDYNAINAHNGSRRDRAEFRKLAVEKMSSMAHAHVSALNELLTQSDISERDRSLIEGQLREWDIMQSYYKP
ncbi:MAG: hypothetical protein JNL11_09105 [Bdellovibrionaceae bacterium]|nr:hypothetical protein [Pseudobdellovibrionaceae bacterium]